MNSITAHSSSRRAGAWFAGQYEVLHQIFRDACSDEMLWKPIPKEGGIEPFYCLRNIETGDTILCRGHADGSHTFVFTGT